MKPRGKLHNSRELIEFMQDQCYKMLAIAEAKSADYAGNGDPFMNFRLGGGLGMAVRMGDKISRIHNFERRGSLAVATETIEDTALDLANYALLYLAWHHNLKEETKNVVAQESRTIHRQRREGSKPIPSVSGPNRSTHSGSNRSKSGRSRKRIRTGSGK